MKNIRKRLTMLLAAVLVITMAMPMTAWAASGVSQDVKDAIQGSDAYLRDNSDDAWSVFARARNIDADHTEDYYVDYYEGLDVESLNSAGDNAKALLALRAMGRGDSEKAQTIENKLVSKIENGALDKTNDAYSIPSVVESLSGEIDYSNTQYKTLVDAFGEDVVKERYDIYGWMPDLDGTSMGVTALATIEGYDMSSLDDASKTPKSIYDFLTETMDTEGRIPSMWSDGPELTAQVLVSLIESGKNPADYANSGNNAVDGILYYYNSATGAFQNTSADNEMATYEANYALVEYERYAIGGKSLFDFSDVTAVYYFSFDGNGATGTMKTQAIEAGDTKKLNANTFINNGYKFVGWKDASGNTYTDEQAVKASKDVKLYAVWERIAVKNPVSDDERSFINLNTYYDDVMRVKSLNAMNGDWKLNAITGKWTFFIDGQQVKGRWVLAINPSAGRNKAGWFYFDENGDMLTGWQKIKGEDGIERWYYLNPHKDVWYGACFRNTITPDGYTVDSTGAWMDPNLVSQEEIQKVADKAAKDTAGTGTSASADTEQGSQNSKKITISVSVSGNIVSGSEEVKLNKNASAYDALKALAKQMGWSISGGASYVKGIGGEMEKSAGPLSGWTYSVNGDTPNKSAGSYKLKDGDSVDWTFVDEPLY